MSGLVLALVLAQAPAPFARARLEPSDAVTVGQPISVVVEVLVPSYFMGAPRFPSLEVRDAVVIFERRGANFSERVGGESFAGQRRRYQVYPQRAGELSVPPVDVSLRYFAADGGATDTVVSTEPLRFEAIVPPGAAGLDPFIATRELHLVDVVEPIPTELEVGQAFTRTLTVTVVGALSMVVPPLGLEPVEGLAFYPGSPQVTDSGGERGAAIVGTRVETATYVAEQAGHYRLPGLRVEWWDTTSQARRVAAADPLEFDVVEAETEAALTLPADPSVDETEHEGPTGVPRSSRLGRLLTIGAIAALVMGAVVRAERFVAPKLERARERRRLSEPFVFARFRDAALSGDPEATARTFMAWLDAERRTDVVEERLRPALFTDFAKRAGDAALLRQARALDALLYGRAPSEVSFSGQKFYVLVARARARRPERPRASDELPSLNL